MPDVFPMHFQLSSNRKKVVNKIRLFIAIFLVSNQNFEIHLLNRSKTNFVEYNYFYRSPVIDIIGLYSIRYHYSA